LPTANSAADDCSGIGRVDFSYEFSGNYAFTASPTAPTVGFWPVSACATGLPYSLDWAQCHLSVPGRDRGAL